MLPNRTGVVVADDALTSSPHPGVENSAPRGELLLKKLAGSWLGDAKVFGTPAQLTWRRPVGNVPLTTPLLGPPRLVRNWVTVDWSVVETGPVPENSCAAWSGAADTPD